TDAPNQHEDSYERQNCKNHDSSSHVDIDDSPNHKSANRDQSRRAPHHVDADVAMPKNTDHSRVDDINAYAQHDRKQGKNQPCKTPLRRMHHDLALEP